MAEDIGDVDSYSICSCVELNCVVDIGGVFSVDCIRRTSEVYAKEVRDVLDRGDIWIGWIRHKMNRKRSGGHFDVGMDDAALCHCVEEHHVGVAGRLFGIEWFEYTQYCLEEGVFL